MLTTAWQHAGPAAVRYPRGTGTGIEPDSALDTVAIGKAEVCRQGERVAILAFGSRVAATLEAGNRINATVVNMRFVKPLDKALIAEMAEHHKLILTVEENAVQGGAGSAVNEVLHGLMASVRVLNLGIPDRFIEHGTHEEQLAECALDAAGILAAIAGLPGEPGLAQGTQHKDKIQHLHV